ncbi:hypothetical protein [Pseudomonas plecoglossicida]|uniref:hypothetical protein n=1 Tax=Pseudomonas plecoglossicida TaxID=70775 RepID=UPI003D258721
MNEHLTMHLVADKKDAIGNMAIGDTVKWLGGFPPSKVTAKSWRKNAEGMFKATAHTTTYAATTDFIYTEAEARYYMKSSDTFLVGQGEELVKIPIKKSWSYEDSVTIDAVVVYDRNTRDT